MSTPPQTSSAGELPMDPALADALRALLAPIAQLALARGLPCGALEEMLKEAFVDEALRAQPGLSPARAVSRISVATGLNRREVTRLTRRETAARQVRPSLASEVFARWMTDPSFCDEPGSPRILPRVSSTPGALSFEALAQAVTRDVHPRSFLEEMCRLGVAEFDAEADTVRLVRNAFVPSGEQAPMLGFLGDNVGDHLSASVANVLAEGEPPHFEQAVFADELSVQSEQAVRQFVLAQWKQLMREAVPLLEGLIEADAEAGRAQDRRVRIGLYSYAADMRPPQKQEESEK